MFISSQLTHHSRLAGSTCVALSTLSAIIRVRRASMVAPSWGYRIRPAFYYTHCGTNPTTHWQVAASFAYREKILLVINSGMPGTTLPRLHRRVSSSSLTSRTSTRALSSKLSGSLQSSSNCQFRLDLRLWIDIDVHRRHRFYRLFLWQHSTNDGFQDLRLDTQAETQTSQHFLLRNTTIWNSHKGWSDKDLSASVYLC